MHKDGRVRVMAFVDGFNVYHFLNNVHKAKYKWLNYRALAERFLPRNAELVGVKYFTALATWDQQKVRRHQFYIRALRAFDIDVIVGKFKGLRKKIVIRNDASPSEYATVDGPLRGTVFFGYTFEEKKTDVSIGCEMVARAGKNEFDVGLLISGDTDFEPAIRISQKEFHKRFIVAVPNKRISGSIQALVGRSNCVTIREKDLEESLLPDSVVLPDGGKITRPIAWQ